MRVGDLVIPISDDVGIQGVDYGIGLITDSYYNDADLTEYFCVDWQHEYQWWADTELKILNSAPLPD